MSKKKDTLIDRMVKFELGELEFYDALLLFSDLTKRGDLDSLPTIYSGACRQAIKSGWLEENGEMVINRDEADVLMNKYRAYRKRKSVEENDLWSEDDEYDT